MKPITLLCAMVCLTLIGTCLAGGGGVETGNVGGRNQYLLPEPATGLLFGVGALVIIVSGWLKR